MCLLRIGGLTYKRQKFRIISLKMAKIPQKCGFPVGRLPQEQNSLYSQTNKVQAITIRGRPKERPFCTATFV